MEQQTDPEYDELLAGLVPEFTVWLVRRGKRFPMVIDSVWMHEGLARKRAALLGTGEGWYATPYSHLVPPERAND